MPKEKKKHRLGRGLSTLMAQPVQVQLAPGTDSVSGALTAILRDERLAQGRESSIAGGTEVVQLSLADIKPNAHQPRQRFDKTAIKELADSIRQIGLMQPILVRPSSEGQYELVAGERRWRAAGEAGLATLPAIVHQLSESQSAQWALVENLQRQDLNPMERAKGFEHLIAQFGLGHDEIAKQVGIKRSTVTNLLRLLKLHVDVQELVAQGALSNGQARALAALEQQDQQLELATLCIRKDMSVRSLEAIIRNRIDHPGQVVAHPKLPHARYAHLADLEKQIAQKIGSKVKIRPGRRKGSGTLCLDFYSLDQFDDLLKKLGVDTQDIVN